MIWFAGRHLWIIGLGFVLELSGAEVGHPHADSGDVRSVVHRALPKSPPPVELVSFFRPPADRTSDFGAYRSPLLFKNGVVVTNSRQWLERRQEILAEWHQAMGPWPSPIENPGYEIVAQTNRLGIMQQQLRIEIAIGHSWVDALLLTPKTARVFDPKPAVLVVYYDAETSAGYGTEYRDYAWQLAQRGFVTLAIGKPNAKIDLSHLPPKSTEQYLGPVGEIAQVEPLSALAHAASNARRFLAHRPEVQASQIGIVGHSFGGKWTLMASCLDDQFACAVWSDPGIVFDERDRRKDNPSGSVNYWDVWYLGFELGKVADPKNAGPFRLPPSEQQSRTGAYRILVEGGHDLTELHALMAPRPFLVSGGTADRIERWSALNHAYSVNRLLGQQYGVAFIPHETHAPTKEANEQVYQFFEWALQMKK